MIQGYNYPLVNGKNKIVGYYYRMFPLNGKYVYIPFYSMLKEPYGIKKSMAGFTVPLETRLIADDGVEYTYQRFLNVKGLTKRQLNAVKANY
jgi:hypothetical protein